MPKQATLSEEEVPLEETKPVQAVEEEVTADQLQNRYLNLKVGYAVDFVSQKLKKLTAPGHKYNLSGVDHKYELHTTDGKILSITAWKLWNQLRVIFRDAGRIDGIKFKISHPKSEEYKVEWEK